MGDDFNEAADGFIYLPVGEEVIRLKRIGPAALAAVQDAAVQRRLRNYEKAGLARNALTLDMHAKVISEVVRNPPDAFQLCMHDWESACVICHEAAKRAGDTRSLKDIKDALLDVDLAQFAEALLTASGVRIERVPSDPTLTTPRDGPGSISTSVAG